MRGLAEVKEGCLDRDRLGVHLVELLCARLCHDLAGAVGAIGAGAELLADEGPNGPMAAEAIGLLSISAAGMAARLRFLRAALGPTGGDMAREARILAQAYIDKGFPQGEWKLDWPVERHTPETADQAKLLLNLICLAQDCLPRGGTIAVRPGAAEAVSGSGNTVIEGEGLKGLGCAVDSLPGPRAAQGAYAARLAAQSGLRITVRRDAAGVAFSLPSDAP